MAARHLQNRQPGATDWSWLCSRICKICFNFWDCSHARDGIINLRENPSTISSLVLFAWLNLPIPHEWAKSSYECPKQCKNVPESITIQLPYQRMPYEFGTNHARFFKSGNSWPKFWTVQNFWAEFPIDLRIARTHYGLCESVKTITNCIRFSHESKYLSIRGIRGLWGIGVYSAQATNRPNRYELIFFFFGGIREVSLFFLQSWWATSHSQFRYDVVTNIRGNRLNSAGIAQEFITIRK